ncbi:hypothetical protein X546_20200 [Brevibacillus borstelensis cifa_chp40]|nr:hypothetical protein X546_20200 [Brevibacillus borstelensis cifa_chp40]
MMIMPYKIKKERKVMILLYLFSFFTFLFLIGALKSFFSSIESLNNSNLTSFKKAANTCIVFGILFVLFLLITIAFIFITFQ